MKFKLIRKEGGSRVLSVTEIVPSNWTAVKTRVTKKTKNAVYICIEKVV